MVDSEQPKKFECPMLTQKYTIHLPINKKSENNEDSAFKTYQALIRENSVYKYYVELKEDVLTNQGFFALAKIPGLRVSGAGQFLKNLRLMKKLRRKDIAKLFNVSCSLVKSWENNYSNLPIQSLVKVAEECGISRDSVYSLIDLGIISTKTALPVKFEKIRDIVQYFSPSKSSVDGQISVINPSKDTLSKIKSILNVKLIANGISGKRIFSRELYNYLTTFFRYTHVPKIRLPLTSEVKRWHDNGVDLKRAIIIPCLQSDGWAKHPKSSDYNAAIFLGRNRVLHNYFVDAMYFEYDILPTSYCLFLDNKIYYTAYTQKIAHEIIDGLRMLAGNTKTSPAMRQTVEEYLKESQPHLRYLINALETEQQIALRIWMSTEGYVTIKKNRGYIYPLLGLACAHPALANQLQQIAKKQSIPFYLRRSKITWSGIHQLCNETIFACIEFLKLGGFIKYVKISSRSKYYENIDKDILLLGILEFKKRERENQNIRELSTQQVHYKINKIIKNREYKSQDFYIDYFSN